MSEKKINKTVSVGICQICDGEIELSIQISEHLENALSAFTTDSVKVKNILIAEVEQSQKRRIPKSLFCAECKTKLKKLLDSQL